MRHQAPRNPRRYCAGGLFSLQRRIAAYHRTGAHGGCWAIAFLAAQSMKQELAIHNRVLREGGSLFIVAECGVTCNYDLAMTKQLIDVVAESGADGIKLIFWFPDEIMSDHSITYSYETLKGEASENMYDMLSKLRFTLDEWKQIKAYADSKNIVLFSTVNSP